MPPSTRICAACASQAVQGEQRDVMTEPATLPLAESSIGALQASETSQEEIRKAFGGLPQAKFHTRRRADLDDDKDLYGPVIATIGQGVGAWNVTTMKNSMDKMLQEVLHKENTLDDAIKLQHQKQAVTYASVSMNVVLPNVYRGKADNQITPVVVDDGAHFSFISLQYLKELKDQGIEFTIVDSKTSYHRAAENSTIRTMGKVLMRLGFNEGRHHFTTKAVFEVVDNPLYSILLGEDFCYRESIIADLKQGRLYFAKGYKVTLDLPSI